MTRYYTARIALYLNMAAWRVYVWSQKLSDVTLRRWKAQ